VKKCGYARVWWSTSGVWLYCTESGVVDWILSELRKIVPTLKVSIAELPSGDPYFWAISRLKGQDTIIGYWVIKQLCEQGWEPFAVQSDQDIHLRLVG